MCAVSCHAVGHNVVACLEDGREMLMKRAEVGSVRVLLFAFVRTASGIAHSYQGTQN
jgi:hypothetical protein